MQKLENKHNDNLPKKEISRYLMNNLITLKLEKELRIQNSIEILQNGDENARWIAIGVLGETGDDQIIPYLINSLEEDVSPKVRAAAAEMLGNYVDNEDVFSVLLNSSFTDSDPEVCKSAFKSLQGIVVKETKEGEYISFDTLYKLKIKEKKQEESTLITFFQSSTKKMHRLKEFEVFLLGSNGFIKSKTNEKGLIKIDNQQLKEKGFNLKDKYLRFFIK